MDNPKGAFIRQRRNVRSQVDLSRIRVFFRDHRCNGSYKLSSKSSFGRRNHVSIHNHFILRATRSSVLDLVFMDRHRWGDLLTAQSAVLSQDPLPRTYGSEDLLVHLKLLDQTRYISAARTARLKLLGAVADEHDSVVRCTANG